MEAVIGMGCFPMWAKEMWGDKDGRVLVRGFHFLSWELSKRQLAFFLMRGNESAHSFDCCWWPGCNLEGWILEWSWHLGGGWRHKQTNKHTNTHTQSRWMDQTLQKAHLPQTFYRHRMIASFYCLSQFELCFLLSQWISFIFLMPYGSSDSMLQAPKGEGTVWSGEILAWHRQWVTASLDFNPFGEGAKVRQAHLKA